MSKRRVLYLIPDLLGQPNGIARYCSLVHRALKQSGVEAVVVALHDRPDAVAADGSGLDSDRYFPCAGSRSLFAARALSSTLLTRPDAIIIGHVNFVTVGLALARLVSAKTVVFAYGAEVWAPLQPTRGWALRQADRVIAISHFSAEKVAAVNGVQRGKLRVLFNCLDPDLAGRAPETQGGPRSPRLLTVGRISHLERYKGHDVVMRALPDLLHRFPDLVYSVVGDGGARSGLEALARDLGVHESVCFHGIVSDSELSALYARSDVMVMPSAREGFGFVFLEAMAHATPAVGGNLDATPEVISDGETGFVVDPKSVSAVRDAVSRLLADDALRARMASAAVKRATGQFGFPIFRDQLIGHLDELLD